MAEYGAIYKKLWNKPRFYNMSGDSQRFLLYLFTGPGSKMCGICDFHIYNMTTAKAFKWSPEHTGKRFRELLENGWVKYDKNTNILLVNNWFNFRTLMNENMLKKAMNEISEMEYSELFVDLINQMRTSDSRLSEQMKRDLLIRLVKQFDKRLPETVKAYANVNENENIDIDMAIIKELALLFNKKTKRPIPRVKIDSLSKENNPTRIGKIEAMIKKHGPAGEWWEKYFDIISKSEFLTGKNDNGFTATFDWIMIPANMIKIIEGNYNTKGKKGKKGSSSKPGKRDDFNTHVKKVGAENW